MTREKGILLWCTVAAALAYGSPVDMMVGARGYGLGGAYVAVVDDATAAYWNPAGLSAVEGATIQESNWIFQDVTGLNVNYLSAAIPIKLVGTVSGSWLYQRAVLEQMGENDNVERATAGEHQFSLSVGRRLWDELLIFRRTSVGFSINRYTFLTRSGNGAGLGFDIGLQTQFPQGFSLGVTGRTLATEVMGAKIDPELRFGIGWSGLLAAQHRLTVDIDGSYKLNRDYRDTTKLTPARNNVKGYGGLEYALALGDWEVAVRGGANRLVYGASKTVGWAAGLGVKFLGYGVQYAFKGDADEELGLGYSHRVDLSIDITRLTPVQTGRPPAGQKTADDQKAK